MPVRFFIYLGEEFQKIIAKQGMEKLYSSSLIKLPTPKCVVFYNGTRREPEECVLRLSDAYEQPQEDPDVELKVRFLNINFGVTVHTSAIDLKSACLHAAFHALADGRSAIL